MIQFATWAVSATANVEAWKTRMLLIPQRDVVGAPVLLKVQLLVINPDDLLLTRMARKRSGLDGEVIEFERAETALELLAD